MNLRRLFKYRFLSLAFLAGLALVLGGWLWAFFALKEITTPLIILFDTTSGIEQIGYASDLARVGVFGLMVVLVNFFISIELEERMPFWGRLTSFTTVFLGILIFIYFAAIISVN